MNEQNPAKRSIYLAGPFFNPQELAIIKAVEDVCESVGIVCNSPRKFMVLEPKAPWDDRRAVFLENVRKINESELVLACIDGSGPLDSGTAWEMGYAYATKRPVVGFSLEGKQINVMLAQGTDGFLRNIEEVRQFLVGKQTGYAEYEESGLPWNWNWEVATAWLKDIY